MDQRIFDLRLSVEATSLYLLMVPLSDAGTVLTRENILPFWNAAPEALDPALEELTARQVLEPAPHGQWYLRPFEDWVQPE